MRPLHAVVMPAVLALCFGYSSNISGPPPVAGHGHVHVSWVRLRKRESVSLWLVRQVLSLEFANAEEDKLLERRQRCSGCVLKDSLCLDGGL